MVISGVGTGGTLTGVGEVLKARKPDVKMIAVEPEDSPILSGGEPGPHKIQGIGAGLRAGHPRHRPDRTRCCASATTPAFRAAREAAATEGLPVGISSGAAIAAALEVAARPEMAGKSIVVILPSFAERYLSTAPLRGALAGRGGGDGLQAAAAAALRVPLRHGETDWNRGRPPAGTARGAP